MGAGAVKPTTIAASVGIWLLIVATAAFPDLGRLLGPQAGEVAFAGLPVIVLMFGIARLQQIAGRAEREQAAAVDAVLAAERTAAYPGGTDCPPGTCPVCGQHDPDRLERCWGHLDAHPSCAEWVRELPPKPKERRPDCDDYLRRKAREQRRQAACPHRNVRPHGDGRTGVCMDCYAVGELIKPETPPPAGEITLPSDWTPEQVEAFRVAWAAAAPEGQPVKGKVVIIQDGEHPCRHDRTQAVERRGAPTMRICLGCGRDATPQPPPGPGSATTAR